MKSPLISTFIDLVYIPSPSGFEKEVRNYVLNSIKPHVDKYQIDKTGNLYAIINGGKKGSLLLCAHLDTVHPTGVQKPIIKNGIISSTNGYVLGADNKAGVAILIDLIKSVKNNRSVIPTLEFIFSVQEETVGGLRNFPKEILSSKLCLMIDLSSPLGTTLIAAPYVGGYAYTINAPGGHVREFTHSTVHPLNFLSSFIMKMPFGRINNDTIINISKIKMGESYNSIPQSIYFTGEIRTFKKEAYSSFFKKIPLLKIFLDKKLGTNSICELFHYSKGYSLKTKNDRNLTTLENVFQRYKIAYNPITTFSVGDFNIVNEWGIKTINIANGSKYNHTSREQISIEDLELISRVVKDFTLEH